MFREYFFLFSTLKSVLLPHLNLIINLFSVYISFFKFRLTFMLVYIHIEILSIKNQQFEIKTSAFINCEKIIIIILFKLNQKMSMRK